MNRKAFFILLVAALFTLSSCVDERFNDRLSTEAEIFSNGLGIPIGYSNQLRLDSLLKTGEFLFVDAQGNYYIRIEDSLEYKIPSFDTAQLTLPGFIYDTNQFFQLLPASARFSRTKSAAQSTFEVKDTLSFSSEGSLPNEIIAIKKTLLRRPTPIKTSLKFSNIPQSLQSTPILIRFRAELPASFNIGTPNNYLEFTDTLQNSNTINNTVYFSKYEKEIRVNNGLFHIEENIPLRITLSLADPNYTPTLQEITAITNANVEYSFEIGKMHIGSVEGKLLIGINETQSSVKLDQLSSFFSENQKNVLDFNKINILLYPQTMIGFNPTIKFISYRNNAVSNTETVSLSILPEGNPFFLSNKPEMAPAGYNAVRLNTTGLFRSMPDSLLLKWSGQTDTSAYTLFDFFKSYSVSGKFGVEAPLDFGENLFFSLRDSIQFSVDASQLDQFLTTGKVSLKGRILTTFPFNLLIHINALDEQNLPIGGLSFDFSIPQFSIELTSKQEDLLKKTKKWEVVAEINGQPAKNSIINAQQFFQLERLWLEKEGGIIIR